MYKNLARQARHQSPKRESVQRRWKPSSCRQTMMKRICMMSCANMKSERARQEPTIQAFVAMIEECRMLVDTISIDQLLEKVLEDSGYLDMLREDKEIRASGNIKGTDRGYLGLCGSTSGGYPE